jgi:Skp family chaperone for outer membrane proteins
MAGRTAWLALGLWLALAPPPAFAQQATPPQLLTLDQERLYSDSLYGKALEEKSLADTQALAAENRKIEADLSAEEAALTERRKLETPEAFEILAEAFDAKVEKIRAEQEAKAIALKSGRDTQRQQFFDAAVPVLAELMRQSGAYAILNHDAVILSFDSIDITTRAIAALDATLGDGTAPPEPPAP